MQINKADFLFLTALQQPEIVTILAIQTSLLVKKRLADLGILPNTKIEFLRKITQHGPIELKVHGAKIVLGKNIASKIIIHRQVVGL